MVSPARAAIATLAALAACGEDRRLALDASVDATPTDGASPPDANVLTDGGDYRCDGTRAQVRGRAGWIDAGTCSLDDCHGILHWDGAGWGAGSACLPGGYVGVGNAHTIVGSGDAAWTVRQDLASETSRSMVFRWDGVWWTRIVTLPMTAVGIARAHDGAIWVYGDRIVRVPDGPPWDAVDLTPDPSTRVADLQIAADGRPWAVGRRADCYADDECAEVMFRGRDKWGWVPLPGDLGQMYPTALWIDGVWPWVATQGEPHVYRAHAYQFEDTWTESIYPMGILAGFGPDDVWLGDGHHWNGSAWSVPPGWASSGDAMATYLAEGDRRWALVGIGPGWSGHDEHTELWELVGDAWVRRTDGLASALAGEPLRLTSAWAGSFEDVWLTRVGSYQK